MPKWVFLPLANLSKADYFLKQDVVINPNGPDPTKLNELTLLEGKKMTAIIFFGGMVAGFLVGWISLALLTMASRSNRDEEQALACKLAHPHPESG